MKANFLAVFGGCLVGSALSTPYWGNALFGRGHTQFESAAAIVAIVTVSVLLLLLGRLTLWLATRP